MKTAERQQHREPATESVMQRLLDLGQSVWLDDLQRRATRSGQLQAMVEDGLRGETSNPTIFEQGVTRTSDYDDAIARRAAGDASDQEILEAIMVEDIQEAADIFRPVYDATDGGDGFVSIEVAPDIARDTEASIADARRLWYSVDRPNVMVKIPGTREGWPAIEQCLTEGININITLLFSKKHYRAVAEGYLRALETRIAQGLPVDHLASVASIFVSRVDTEADRRIGKLEGDRAHLRGQVAVANARLIYAEFLRLTRTPRWQGLAAQGARVQRPLWASTGTKNPEYSDVLYVDSLIGADTITTVPPETLRRFEDHGTVRTTLPGNVDGATQVLAELEAAGISFADINETLEREGIEKFTRSHSSLLQAIRDKRNARGP